MINGLGHLSYVHGEIGKVTSVVIEESKNKSDLINLFKIIRDIRISLFWTLMQKGLYRALEPPGTARGGCIKH